MKKAVSIMLSVLILMSSLSFILASITGDVVITVKAIDGTEADENIIEMEINDYTNTNGKIMQIKESVEKSSIKVEGISADTEMEMTREGGIESTQLKVMLSNGVNAEVKIMPDNASVKAIERLKVKVCSEDNDCEIELKEIGKGEEVRVAYEVKVTKQSKLFGFINKKMQVQAQVDAETGEIIKTKRPWWSFLAKETDETD